MNLLHRNVCFLAAIACVVPPASGQICLEAPRSYPAGPGPVVTADFNGDGHEDVVVGGWPGWSGFAILLGDGQGGLEAPYGVPVQFETRSLVAADFDEDGHTDLAVVNYGLKIFLGDGSGDFDEPIDVPGLPLGRPIVTADLNGDGHVDLAAATGTSCNDDGAVRILMGNGRGGFEDPLTVGADRGAGAVTTADLDGDGHLDLAVVGNLCGGNGFGVSVILADGRGGFGETTTVAQGSHRFAIVAVDLNKDRIPDLAFDASGGVAVLIGDGTGGFGPVITYPTGETPTSNIVPADFNEDGHVDLALGRSNGQLRVLTGDGRGGFGDPFIGTGYGMVAVADFDEDGNVDLVAGGKPLKTLSIHLGDGLGGFGDTPTYPATPNGGPSVMADFNEDGHGDLAVVSNAGNVSVLIGDGRAGFEPPVVFYAEKILGSIAAADFDEDGHVDLLVGGVSQCIMVFRGDGTGGFGNAENHAAGEDTGLVVTADFNEDGHVDVSTAADEPSDTVHVLLGDGLGGFSIPIAATVSAGGWATSMTAADVDDDGHVDLILGVAQSADGPGADVGLSAGILNVGLGDGKGGFTQWGEFGGWGGYPTSVRVNDLNEDGTPDLAVATTRVFCHAHGCAFFGDVSMLAGDGLSSFGSPVTLLDGLPAGSLIVEDLDLDGHLDLVALQADVMVLPGLGAGVFGSPVGYRVALSGFLWNDSLFTADLNEDGRPDLAAVSDSVAVLVGCCARLGDVDGDCRVNDADLHALLDNWGSCPDCQDCPTDLDGDCVTGITDLLLLLGNWE